MYTCIMLHVYSRYTYGLVFLWGILVVTKSQERKSEREKGKEKETARQQGGHGVKMSMDIGHTPVISLS